MKLEVYVGLDEFEIYFQSNNKLLTEYAESTQTVVQLVFQESIDKLPVFSDLSSVYVLRPLSVGNIIFEPSDRESIRESIRENIYNTLSHYNSQWTPPVGFDRGSIKQVKRIRL